MTGTCIRCGGALRPSPPFAWCSACQAVTVVVRPGYVPHEDWTDLAACRGLTETFFPSREGKHRRAGADPYTEAKVVCATCPVRPECLADWLDMPAGMQPYGMRAGFSSRYLLGVVRAVRRLARAA